MPAFRRYDVVAVPFPYTDRAVLARRPALVVSRPILEQRFGLLWVLMITAAENAAWTDDIPIPDHRAAGLPIPSIIRPGKIATVETGRALAVGRIPPSVARVVDRALETYLC